MASPERSLVLTPRQRLLLSYVAGGDEELDPIRIVKGLFVFCQEVPKDWVDNQALYEFEPYSYGPFSFALYHDLEALHALGVLAVREQPDASWKFYHLTDLGRQLATEARTDLDPKAVRYLDEVRKVMLSMDFRTLLRAIYKKYPEYAVNSVFNR